MKNKKKKNQEKPFEEPLKYLTIPPRVSKAQVKLVKKNNEEIPFGEPKGF